MDVYMFRAALFCEDCGLKLLEETPKPQGFDPENESSWDSDDYPKGPYSDGGGEADCPQHCDSCSVFLKNPLTSDGEDYLKETLYEELERATKDKVSGEWLRFYGAKIEITGY